MPASGKAAARIGRFNKAGTVASAAVAIKADLSASRRSRRLRSSAALMLRVITQAISAMTKALADIMSAADSWLVSVDR